MTVGLLFVVFAMYQCLVHYTGAKPAEHYSLQKRPVRVAVVVVVGGGGGCAGGGRRWLHTVPRVTPPTRRGSTCSSPDPGGSRCKGG